MAHNSGRDHVATPREILQDPHPLLRRTAKKLKTGDLRDPGLQNLIDDMFATVAAYSLIGMAAPQIGVGKRLFVVDFEQDGTRYGPLVVINPMLVQQSGDITWQEASPCRPGFTGTVARSAQVVCCGLDRHGAPIRIEAAGLFAVCIQHEIDHLDGVLCFDKATDIQAIPPAVQPPDQPAGPPRP